MDTADAPCDVADGPGISSLQFEVPIPFFFHRKKFRRTSLVESALTTLVSRFRGAYNRSVQYSQRPISKERARDLVHLPAAVRCLESARRRSAGARMRECNARMRQRRQRLGRCQRCRCTDLPSLEPTRPLGPQTILPPPTILFCRPRVVFWRGAAVGCSMLGQERQRRSSPGAQAQEEAWRAPCLREMNRKTCGTAQVFAAESCFASADARAARLRSS